MPVYKAHETIEQAVESIVSQTYDNWELIIINDNCPNSSCEKVQKLIKSNSKIIRIDNQTNIGVANSRNIGIAKAIGEVIAFLDADDYWHVEKLNMQIAKIKEGYNIVCSNYFRVKETGEITENFHKSEFDYIDMLKSNQVGNLTGLYRCDHLGKFYQQDIGHEDYLMWLTVIKKAKVGYCIQTSLAYYRVSEKSLSANKLKAIGWQWHIYRKELKLSLMASIRFFLNYIYVAYNKHK